MAKTDRSTGETSRDVGVHPYRQSLVATPACLRVEMLTHPKTLNKLRRLEDTYRALIFAPLTPIPVRMLPVGTDHRRSVPGEDEAGWIKADNGTAWGGPWENAWFAGSVSVPDEQAGQPLWLAAETGAVETLVWVDGETRGILAREIEVEMGSRGNHHALRITAGAAAGTPFAIALECYAGHPCPGTHPFDSREHMTDPMRYHHRFERVSLLRRRDAVADFVFDLMTCNRLVASLPDDDFRRARVIAVLSQILPLVTQDPAPSEEASWIPCLERARSVLAPVLSETNGAMAPRVGLVGHSHMDTAWMWTIDETIRKCARTFASVLTLMEQYPEYTFFQSAPYHLELIRRHYPQLYERIVERVREGRWQLEGGTWIEPDCNIPSGESMVRQFLWGQRAIHAITGQYSSTYWQPDVFGYNAALPQIMLGSGIRSFCTTKLSWNETNAFPHDSFIWRGIDGSDVFTHFNIIHCWPDPQALITLTAGIKHKDYHQARLCAYGYGDGGGGPMFEMLEMARRCTDLAGCPRAEHVNAADFLEELAESADHPVWQGELYLELHRGSLTSKHRIKAGNRRLEQALRDLEIVDTALASRRVDRAELDALWEDLLVNQFHDILPGTSLAEVHDRATAELERGVARAEALISELLAQGDGQQAIRVVNTLGFERSGNFELRDLPPGLVPSAEGLRGQVVEDVDGRAVAITAGLVLPALAALDLDLAAPTAVDSPFRFDGSTLVAPRLTLVFDPSGGIASWRDHASGRELRSPGCPPLNTLLIGEDVPQVWDNWDIDADQYLQMAPVRAPDSLRVVADGPLQWRLRIERRIGAASRLVQDVIVDADGRGVAFDTRIDWYERHVLLKASFPLAIHAERCRHEIQFGHVQRPVHSNLPTDRAQFEVSNHRFTDLSESRFGAALLNDSSYGLSTRDGDLQLSLLKAGTHPDPRGDDGVHRLRYALLPHDGFSTQNVVHPAITFNAPVRWAPAAAAGGSTPSFCEVDTDHVLIEAIKRAEDGQGLIIRLYECEGATARCRLRFATPPERVTCTDLLERDGEALEIAADGSVELECSPFAIRSVRVIFR